jgi:hypothetical protein
MFLNCKFYLHYAAVPRILRTKYTRQRCHKAWRTLPMAALIPSFACEMTSLTPRRPRRARKNLPDGVPVKYAKPK